jgi:hypothetical protein
MTATSPRPAAPRWLPARAMSDMFSCEFPLTRSSRAKSRDAGHAQRVSTSLSAIGGCVNLKLSGSGVNFGGGVALTRKRFRCEPCVNFGGDVALMRNPFRCEPCVNFAPSHRRKARPNSRDAMRAGTVSARRNSVAGSGRGCQQTSSRVSTPC